MQLFIILLHYVALHSDMLCASPISLYIFLFVRGLGLHQLFLKFLKLYSDSHSLVLAINTSSDLEVCTYICSAQFRNCTVQIRNFQFAQLFINCAKIYKLC